MLALALLLFFADPPCPAFVDHAQNPFIYHQPASITALNFVSPADVTYDEFGQSYTSGSFWLPSVRVGKLYCDWVLAEGGKPPYIYAAAGLPRGMTLDPLTGALQGRPNKPGTYQMTFSVRDAAGNSVTLAPRTQTICQVASLAPCL